MEKKSIAIILVVTIGVVGIVFLGNLILNKYSLPEKETRLYNLRVYMGITDLKEMDDSLIASDISAALSKYTNWDNLFLSEHFKEKYKNRKNILDDVRHIAKVSSGIIYQDGEPVVLIFAEKKTPLFNLDESDDITTMYYFKYVLNEEGEIDDLILLKKQDVYTIDGTPVDGSEWYGWQE